ncbi:MAG: DJ-1 family glyoxalase III [Myxococcota bacterium]
MARVLVPLAEGFEEIETASIVDVLRRGGIEVILAGTSNAELYRGSRGIIFQADVALTQAEGPWSMVILPGGGKGVENLLRCELLLQLLRARAEAREPVAAICAGPRVLDAVRALPPGQFTCYPGLQAQLKSSGRRSEVVVDAGHVITSQGPGTAMTFALYLLGRLRGEEVRAEVARGLLVH